MTMNADVDGAIAIILRAMKDVDAEHGPTWYLPWMKLHRVLYYLVDVKYDLMD
jgi:hypothetical protein